MSRLARYPGAVSLAHGPGLEFPALGRELAALLHFENAQWVHAADRGVNQLDGMKQWHAVEIARDLQQTPRVACRHRVRSGAHDVGSLAVSEFFTGFRLHHVVDTR